MLKKHELDSQEQFLQQSRSVTKSYGGGGSSEFLGENDRHDPLNAGSTSNQQEVGRTVVQRLSPHRENLTSLSRANSESLYPVRERSRESMDVMGSRGIDRYPSRGSPVGRNQRGNETGSFGRPDGVVRRRAIPEYPRTLSDNELSHAFSEKKREIEKKLSAIKQFVKPFKPSLDRQMRTFDNYHEMISQPDRRNFSLMSSDSPAGNFRSVGLLDTELQSIGQSPRTILPRGDYRTPKEGQQPIVSDLTSATKIIQDRHMQEDERNDSLMDEFADSMSERQDQLQKRLYDLEKRMDNA